MKMANDRGDTEKCIQFEQEIIEGILHIQKSGERADSASLASFLQENNSLTEGSVVHDIVELLIAGKIESQLLNGREVLKVVSNEKRLLNTDAHYLIDNVPSNESNCSMTDQSQRCKDDLTLQPTQV